MIGAFQRYLSLLGIEGHPADLTGLHTLVRRHLTVVPFENISKLLLYDREAAGRPVTLREFLNSYAPGAWFMNCLRISRVFDGHSLDLINRKLYRHESGQTALTQLDTLRQLRTAVDEQFRMPRCPIERAVDILQRLTGKAFFGA